jgi:hypothetical protein
LIDIEKRHVHSRAISMENKLPLLDEKTNIVG